MSNQFRPEPQDGFSSFDRETYEEREELYREAEADGAFDDLDDDCGDDEIYDDFEDDGQPSEYDEWQDYYGGDDWDHGQYDEPVDW